MIRKLLGVFVLLLTVVFVLVPSSPAHAQATKVNRDVIAAASWNQWGSPSSSNYGAISYFKIDNPPLNDSDDYFIREIHMAGPHLNTADVGIVKIGGTKSPTPACSQKGLYFFWDSYDDNGNVVASGCSLVPSDDLYTYATFTLSNFVSGGGGIHAEINTLYLDGPCETLNSCPMFGALQWYSYIYNYEGIQNEWTGTNVVRQLWQNNQHKESNGVFYFQNVSGTATVNDPPQMYWVTTPGNSTTGGQLASCEIDYSSSC